MLCLGSESFCFCCVCQVKDDGLMADDEKKEEEATQPCEEMIIGTMETI